MKPLAYRIRPQHFEDIFGQDHLVGKQGVLTEMIKKKKFLSFILYGPPGTGKTTIAHIFSHSTGMDTYFFNASTESKARLKDILNTTTYHDICLVIDEIHRMNTDIQDYLLPFLENGKAFVIGITALNPFQAVNQAIRSRCHMFEVKPLDDQAIKEALLRGLSQLDVDFKLDQHALDEIIRRSNHEVRTALNMLEAVSLVAHEGQLVTSSVIRSVTGRMSHDLDKDGTHFYDLLSALQKSIRGSDCDASIHYLARLLTLEDLDSIIRRLLVIAYEDIGLANPQMGPKVLAGCQSSLWVGLPEARIILSNLVIDMALSPKSNTALVAIDDALSDYEKIDTGDLPDHALNRKIKLNPDIYRYPHLDHNAINDQKYMPQKIANKTYYHPKDDSAYEKALKDRLKMIDSIKKIKR
jgi:putative ATPase